MTRRRAPYSIKTAHNLYTASTFDEWKQLALNGKIWGAVIGGVDENMTALFGTAGALHHKPRDAHWVASILADELLKRSRL